MAKRVIIDKNDASRLLLHSAIRLALADNEPIVVHLAAIAANDVLRSVARARGKALAFNIDKFIKPEMRSLFWQRFKSLNNFFKHADQDPDESLDISGICTFNEIEIAVGCLEYRELFGGSSAHMRAFVAFAIAEYPEIITTTPGIPEEFTRVLDQTKGWSRLERMSTMSNR